MQDAFQKINQSFLIACLIFSTLFSLTHQQTNSTVVPPNTDIGPCTCDLTADSCDVSCCCDSDCTTSDRTVFTKCVDEYKFADSQSCFPTTLFFRNNTPFKENKASADLFCIYNDNFQSRNYYTAPSLVTNSENATKLLQTYKTWSFPSSVYGFSYTNPSKFTDYYKVNDPLYVYFTSNLIGKLSLPFAQGTPECSFDNPVQFLVDRTSICARTVTTLINTCTNTPIYNANSFATGFRVAFNPSVFKEVINQTVIANNTQLNVNYNDTNLIPIKISATCVDANGNPETCNTTLTAPEYNATSQTCSKVLKSLTYNVRYSGVNGIKSIDAVVVLTTLSASSSTLQQTFSIKFLESGATPGVPRSGNPGYLVGKPVMGGRFNATTQAVLVSKDPTQWVTIPTGGDCANPTRSPVLFGISTSSGCSLKIQRKVTDFCRQYQTTIYNALRGQSPSDRIATFGNSASSKPGDWVKIYGQDTDVTPTTSANICNQMITGAKLAIIYARAGAIANPQNKIIGASMTYMTGAIAYSCSDFNCLPGATAAVQEVPISIDVTFIDASKTAVPEEAAKPVFLARLPYDFFYPFYVDSGPPAISFSMGLVSLSCALVTFLLNGDFPNF